MWRSNVLGGGSCSFPVPIHRGLRIAKRWYSEEGQESAGEKVKALPISHLEFKNALMDVSHKNVNKTAKRIGLAVSGGVDSMALATLYMRGVGTTNGVLPYFHECHGFIIDHKARPESTEEAEWVAQQLRLKLGMEATVIALAWPADADPNRFESDARSLRYQALGKACREKGIKSLMVAHHADDQAETIMMRLMNNRLRTGLQGMQKAVALPGCYGMHGLHNSGDLDKYVQIGSHEGYKRNYQSRTSRDEPEHDMPFDIERGGIQILRPLLSFEKSRLVATCEEHGTSWAEDKTNQDRTLTPRNAIRHIIQHHKLPEAISTPSLIQLSGRMQKRVQERNAFAEHLFNQTKFKLDIQTGSLTVRIPPANSLLDAPLPTQMKSDGARKKLIRAKEHAQILLTRLAELISPQEKADISTMSNAVPQVFPELYVDGEDTIAKDVIEKQTFCAAKVWWRKWEGPPLFSEEEKGVDWLLSRETPQSSDNPCIVFPSAQTSTTASTPNPVSTVQDTKELQWRLFDGRFWFRVKNNTYYDIVLRHLSRMEYDKLTSTNKTSTKNPYSERAPGYRYIRIAWGLVQPATLRRCLPALFLRKPLPSTSTPDDSVPKYEEQLLALPTLDVRLVRSPEIAPSGMLPCAWDVRYKGIDKGDEKEFHDFVKPAIGQKRIKEEEMRQYTKTPYIEHRLRFAKSHHSTKGQVVSETVADPGKQAPEQKGHSNSIKKKEVRHTMTSEEDREGLSFLDDEQYPAESMPSQDLFTKVKVKVAGRTLSKDSPWGRLSERK